MIGTQSEARSSTTTRSGHDFDKTPFYKKEYLCLA
jgi:hypothetical protein